MKSDYGTVKMRKNAEGIPKLKIDGRERPVLPVDGRKFIILGGEVHNSLLVPVTWDIAEREKGRYDYRMPRKIMEEAGKKKIRSALFF